MGHEKDLLFYFSRSKMKIPVDCLVLKPNIPAGMDWSVIGHFVMIFRKTAQPCDPPIIVKPVGDNLWRVMDGRHRFFAAVIAGRSEIEAEVEL
jgi:hypothetical protein